MTRRRRSMLALGLLASCFPLTFTAVASETVTYSYDARGRLIQVARSGTVNNGVAASYSYDKGDNRTNVTVAGVGGTPAYPGFAVNDVTVTEGSALVFTVTKSGTASSSFSVNYATSNGTAVAGSDYTAGSGTLTFASTDATKTITVPTTDDTAVESAETVTLTLSAATGGSTISDATGVGTINDNDAAPAPSFSVSDIAVTEGGLLTFTVTKTGSTSSSFSVSYATADGTAAAGSDYTAGSGTLTFAAAETTKTVNIATTDDATVESAETLFINLSAATGGSTISDAQGIGTINDNDVAPPPPPPPPPPSFSIGDAYGIEGDILIFTVTRAGTTSGSFSVNFATANGTATSTSDYFATSGTLTFAEGETSKAISVTTVDDATLEAFTEGFTVNLSAASGGATITDAQGAGTIEDNDDGGGVCTEGGQVIICP